MVMWVMGQLCDRSHGSWVTKDDPFPSLGRKYRSHVRRRKSQIYARHRTCYRPTTYSRNVCPSQSLRRCDNLRPHLRSPHVPQLYLRSFVNRVAEPDSVWRTDDVVKSLRSVFSPQNRPDRSSCRSVRTCF